MKKYIILTHIFLLIFATSLQAQVIIGSTEPPHPSSVLEIKSSNLGLLLPNVTLNADSTIFVLSGGNSATAAGMIVYNTANVQEGKGVYLWDGTRWHAIGLSRLQPPSPSPSPSPSPKAIQSNDEKVDSPQTAAKEKNDKIIKQ